MSKFLKFLWVVTLLQLTINGLAQENPYVTEYKLSKSTRFYAKKKITAIAVETKKHQGNHLLVVVDNQTIKIPQDLDTGDNMYFVCLPNPADEVFFPNKIKGKLHLIHSGETPEIKTTINYSSARTSGCSDFSFESVPQSVWRKGLPEPNYNRGFSKVNHIVVHHSAGSNTETNYQDIVREIYIFHTQTKGWSDIGYNYLIAQDGTIFNGRDPADGAQHNVRGAHFCGGNSNTMGICLLGNYEETEPPQAVLDALDKIIKFKLNEEQLLPTTLNKHKFGWIPALVGHKTKCKTLCPGKNVYKRLEDIKSRLKEELKPCVKEVVELDFTASKTKANIYDEIRFTNQSKGYDSYQWKFEGADNPAASWWESGDNFWKEKGTFNVELIGTKDGKTENKSITIEITDPRKLAFTVSQTEAEVQEFVIFFNESKGYDSYKWLLEGAQDTVINIATKEAKGVTVWKTPGEYNVSLIGNFKNQLDTLTKPAYMKILGPTVYPTAMSVGQEMVIDPTNGISNANFVSTDGKIIELKQQNGNFKVPFMEAGVYTLEVFTNKGIKKSKVLIK